MPRVKERVKSKRGKPYVCSRCGKPIEPGERFYYWDFRYGGTRRQHAHHGRPRRSQLTMSKMGDVYAAVEDVEDLISSEGWEGSDVESAMQELSEIAQQTKEEYETAAEPFGGAGPNMEHAEELESFVDSLEQFQMPDALEAEREDDPCPTCKGTGKVEYQPRPDVAAVVQSCADCDGEGHREVEIPAEQMEDWREEVKGAVEDALSEAP